MSHRKNKRERSEQKSEDEFQKQAMRMARYRLQKAIEWIDTGDDGDATWALWALVHARSAVQLLEVAKDI